MDLSLMRLLKHPKLDAVVSFKNQERARQKSRGSTSSVPPSRRDKGGAPRTESPRERAFAEKSRRSSASPKNIFSSRRSINASKGIASSVAAVVGTAAASRKIGIHASQRKKDTTNRAEKLQLKLNAIEAEMNKLRLHEEQLEDRLKNFIKRKTSLVSTIDSIHSKLDGLAKIHKSMSSRH